MTPGWLRRQVDQAAAEVATWPEWQRRLLKERFTPAPDLQLSCVHRHRCREAQTCAGKPCRSAR